MRLASETLGRGPDLVLLHGWGMNAGVWAPVVERLAAYWRLTLIELPGHGESGFDPKHLQLDDWVSACAEVAPSRAIWLGWSLGGLVAQRAAMLLPERVIGLALVSSTPCFVTREDWRCAMDADVFEGFAAQLATDTARTLERFLALQVRGATGERDTLRELKAAVRARPAPSAQALDTGLGLLLNTDLRNGLAQLARPSLWLFGGRDALVPASAADGVACLLPEAMLHRLPAAGHAPFLSHPEACVEQLKRFSESCDV